MTISLGELMHSIETLSVSNMREMAQHLLERAQAKEDRQTMMGVLLDNRQNPNALSKPTHVSVNAGGSVSAGVPLENWKAPGIAAIDKYLPATAEERKAQATFRRRL
jgi:hypothetical protein